MKVEIDLKNCFGIENMQSNFEFDDKNAVAVYSKNGTMKTSLAKTFECIQKNIPDSIRDEIFNIKGEATIKIDGIKIAPEQIFVIKSFEQKYESQKLANLLVDDETRTITEELLNKKELLLKNLSSHSGVAKKDIEAKILKDFSTDKSRLTNLIKDLSKIPKHTDLTLDLKYATIFGGTLENKILSDHFQKNIKIYLEARLNIYKKFKFLQSDNFDLTGFRDFTETIEKSKYFSPNNLIKLNEKEELINEEKLKNIIAKIDDNLKGVSSYQKLEKDLMSSVPARELLSIIRQNPEIIEKLKKDNISQFKKDLWALYLKDNQETISEIEELSKIVYEKLEEARKGEPEWQKVLDKFNSRFKVPFIMKIKNTEEIFLGEQTPRIVFEFKKDGFKTAEIDRSSLETINTLSQGEKRALYLLNILFDIESLKKERGDEPTLLVVDDVADSFDYQNKYTIIEYLSELCEEGNFKLVILSHNFDFYRTISSRLGLKRECRLHTKVNNNTLEFNEEKYQNNPINDWKNMNSNSKIAALIPLARNLSEYRQGSKENPNEFNSIYEALSSILHVKPKHRTIKISELEQLLGSCVNIARSHLVDLDQDKSVTDFILETADPIHSAKDPQLEHKITLAIAIRIKAEKYMVSSLLITHHDKYSSESDVIEEMSANQTRELFNKFRNEMPNSDKKSEDLKTLSRMNIITPEHIHLNSFMYEPILDTDIKELLDLYADISKL